MYLKAITIHGFKTFSQRTHLTFQPGITAIVGPNGSGKSNFADAIRWVLGEQSLRSLRSRRTEDVLFAGASGRPPAGMAEVALAFDNSQQWLDVPFVEVTIARRAYRSGENEYYLNRDRVRLRDVTDLLGRISLGVDGFAVVGQGTVDAALSLRPEDRRGLIEQAAAIGHLYARLDDARNRLVNAQQNLSRVEDLISEITPRLRVLERQARQAREREGLQAEFFRGLVRWYAHLWAGPAARHCQAMEDRNRARTDREIAERERTAAERALRDARDRLSTVEREGSTASERLSLVRAGLAAIDHATALDRDRIEHLRQTDEEYRSILAQNKVDLDRESASIDTLASQRSALQMQLADAQTALDTAEQEADAWKSKRANLDRAVKEARHLQTRVEAQFAAASSRCRSAEERLAQLDRAMAEQRERIVDLEAAAARCHRRVADCEVAAAEARSAVERATAERNQLAEQLQRAEAEVARCAAKLAAIDRDLQTHRARLEALEHVEASGTGYYAGVRSVLQAANGHGSVHLDGIVGVVAKLIEVAPDKELAIETALGSHLQDIVVNRWVDAEAAIAYLKKSGAGRATFLPLDTLRPARRAAPPDESGLLGVASTLVSVEPRFQVVSEFLLGQTLVVENLAVARRILRNCAPFWQIVTLEGEITRPSGVVTGGSAAQTRGTLARHRELRAARLFIARREDERKQAASALAERRSEAQQISARHAELNRAIHDAEERYRQTLRVLGEAKHDGERADHALALRRDDLERSSAQRAIIERELAESREALRTATRERATASQNLETAERERDLLERDLSASVSALATKRTERDMLRERLAAVDAALAQAEGRRRSLEAQARERQAKLDDLRRALDGLQQNQSRRQAEREDLARQIEELQLSVASISDAQERAASAARQAEAIYLQWEDAERQASTRLLDAERRLQLAEAELEGLRQQIYLELGPIEPEALAQGQLRAVPPDGAPVSAPIEPVADAERLRRRLESQRARLRGMSVASDAVLEYESARQRLDFLTEQSADLRRTIATLQGTIDETRSSMKLRFDETFAAVAAGFSRRFVELFGGGSARLVLEGGDEVAGVEVVAQPPGKRAESLAMLSGGERALTAAALLFALIEANPPPFCVLDEVDAALDENNVGRFCSALRELCARTQFIVITHNRRTMEAASTIYGLAVENRCESRVLAMQLPTV